MNKYRDTNTNSNRSSKNRRRNRNRHRFKNRIFKLKTTKIINFDSAETSVAFFIKKFKHIAKKKKKAVLQILLMCLKKSTMKWHNNLFFKIRNKMNRNLIVWKNELFKKYRFNKFDFFEKVKKLKFQFDENLIFNQYLFRKINLLHDNDIFEKHTMIQFIWNEFDVHLNITISVKKNENTLKNFEKRIRKNYQTTKKIHNLNKKIQNRISYRFDRNSNKTLKILIRQIMNRLVIKNRNQYTRIKKTEIIRKSLKITNDFIKFLKKKNHFARVVFVKTIIEIMIVSIKKNQKENNKRNQKNFDEWRRWFERKNHTKRL